MDFTRPTLKDVARKSGFALRTVNKVIGNKDHVSQKARDAVLRAAEELGYSKNYFASALAKNRAIKIAIIYTEITAAYFPEVNKGFLKCVNELRDFGATIEFKTVYEKGSCHQIRVLKEIIENGGYAGVIIQPVSKTKLNPYIEQLTEMDVPVITFGGDCTSDKRLCYIGPNATKSGRIGAQILANLVDEKGNVFIISQGTEHMQTVDRIKGFRDRVAEFYPNLNVFELAIPDNSDLYYEMVKAVVEKENVAGLFCTDANSYVAGLVLRDLHRTDIAVVGFDMSEMAAELMKGGYLKVIINQNPELIAYSALKAMLNFIYYGKQPEQIQHTEVSIQISECLEG